MVDHHKRIQCDLPPEVKQIGDLERLHIKIEFLKDGRYWIDGLVLQATKGQRMWAQLGVYIKKVADKDWPL